MEGQLVMSQHKERGKEDKSFE